jgi:hypothetical protein
MGSDRFLPDRYSIVRKIEASVRYPTVQEYKIWLSDYILPYGGRKQKLQWGNARIFYIFYSFAVLTFPLLRS